MLVHNASALNSSACVACKYRRLVFLLAFLSFVFTANLAAVFLNLLTVGFSLAKTVTGGYKHLIVLTCSNNVLIALAIMFSFLRSITTNDNGRARKGIVRLVIYAMPLSISAFQLVFTGTKLYAVRFPLDYKALCTHRFYRRTALISFVLCYALATVAYVGDWLVITESAAPFSLSMDTVGIVCAMLTVMGMKKSVSDDDVELRQAIRSNLIQSAVPYAINFPAQLGVLLAPAVGGGSGAWGRLLGSFFKAATMSNLLVDPVSFMCTISVYRDLYKQLRVSIRVGAKVVAAVLVVQFVIAVLAR